MPVEIEISAREGWFHLVINNHFVTGYKYKSEAECYEAYILYLLKRLKRIRNAIPYVP